MAIALMLAPLAAPTASAETIPGQYSSFDQLRDVVAVHVPWGASESQPGAVGDSSRVIGDIYRTRIVHQTTYVRVSVKYRALPRAGHFYRHGVYIGTGRTWLLVEDAAGPGNWAGRKTVRRGSALIRCANLVSRIDYTHAMFIVQVPRACLGNPHWVRVDGRMTSHVPEAGGYREYTDFAFTNGFTDRAELSPKVYEPTHQNIGRSGGAQ